MKAEENGTSLLPDGANLALGGPDGLDLISWPGGVADLSAREVRFRDGRRAPLSEREAQLLRFLAAHNGRPVSRDQILLHVWQLNPERVKTRTIDMHVVHLRDKLGEDPHQPRLLLTVRGLGYMLSQHGEACPSPAPHSQRNGSTAGFNPKFCSSKA